MSPSVLVAEDSRLLRTMLRDELAGEGYEVIEAEDGARALALAFSRRPDVVLLDREMPRVDGFAVLEALRRNPRTEHTPVVFVTSHASPRELADGLDRGAHDYLRKPVHAVELFARLRTALRMRDLREELATVARTDALTGLANRREMTHRLEVAVAAERRHRRGLSVAILDVDHFKAINDTRGHAAGDMVLVGLAERLRCALGIDDLLGRWGGEEFLVLVADSDPEGARLCAERLRNAVGSEPIAGIPVTVSVGVAGWRDEPLEEMVGRADKALYSAKEAGRDRVCVAERRTAPFAG